jgi:transketolase
MLAQRIRKIILDQSKRAHVGHIGSALSVADILACLYGGILRAAKPDDPDRDRFVLSKGHAALALYAALFLKGWIDDKTLNSFYADGTFLGVHPERAVPGVDFSTGSLGQGLSFGMGAALAARLQGSSRRVFVRFR